MLFVDKWLTVGENCWLNKVEADCREAIQEQRHEDDEGVNILEDLAENNDRGHDGDGYKGYKDGDGKPSNPVKPIWQSHHFSQLLHSRLLLLNNSLKQIYQFYNIFLKYYRQAVKSVSYTTPR